MTQPDPDGGADLTPEEFAGLMEAMGRPLKAAADPIQRVRIAVEAAEVSITNGLPVDLPEFIAGLRRVLDGQR